MKNRHKPNTSQKRALDTSLYDGPSISTVYNSFYELLADLVADLGESGKSVNLSLVSHWIQRFLTEFWNQSQNCRDGFEVKDLADRCKERRNDLISIANQFIQGEAPAFPGDFYIVLSNKEDPLQVSHLKYVPNSFDSLINYLREVDQVVGFVQLSAKPGFYIYLHRILFHLISHLQLTEEEFSSNKEKVVQLLLLPVSLGQVYEHMNPTPEVMEEYGQKLLDQLRTETRDPSEEFWELFDLVVKDINSRKSKKNQYVWDIIDARRSFRRKNYPSFKSSNYYLTAKASTVTAKVNGRTKKLPSIFASLLENDPIKDDPSVKAFDDMIHYISGYLDSYQILSLEHKLEQQELKVQTDMKTVVTQMIPNPGKYKPRGIHVGCNAVQDRCKYLHHIWSDFLNLIPSCCMIQHYRGVSFLKRVTEPTYRVSERNNVFVSDFSNATDTLNQLFQCRVIEVLFNKTFSDFWKFISELPKSFRHPLTGVMEDYIQNTGQPQGLLGSFDAFSLAHIFLICMLMKKFHLEERSLEDTLAIVGDDSVISYPSELEIKIGDRLTFYEFHSWLCQETSLIKNDAKTGKSFFDINGLYPSEILDFAKISICDGVNMTPIPFGLAAAYSEKPGATDIQLFLWLNSKEITYKKLFYRKILQSYCRKPDQLLIVTSVLSSGVLPFLENFKDEELYLSIDSTIRGLAEYAYSFNQLNHTFFGSILSDNRKDLLSADDFLDRCLNSIEEDFLELEEWLKAVLPSVPSNHKYNVMVNENIQLACDLKDILDVKEEEDDLCLFLAILADKDLADLFAQIKDRTDEINRCLRDDDAEIWQQFCYQDFSAWRELCDPASRFMVKSMKKASSRTVTILRSSAYLAHEWLGTSSYLRKMADDSLTSMLDKLFAITS